MITIKTMAEMLGISTTTVSNVIHGKTKEVSSDMIEKVQQLIREYDYIPNINARNLAQNKSKIIGLALKSRRDKYENFIKDPFAGEITGAVESSVRERGYFTMLYISDVIEEIINSVASWNVDGLILIGMQTEDCIMLKKKFKKPMVFIDSYFDNRVVDYVNVGIEDRKGSHAITKHLIDRGHTKIAFLADNCISGDRERFMGYKDALIEAGIAYSEEDFILIQPEKGRITNSLMEIYHNADKYSAYVCASDYYAVMIMNYLSDRGKTIPEDISIVGFDDNAYSQIVRPALTTVHQDVSGKGEKSVEKLFELFQTEKIVENKVVLPTSVVIRDSVSRIG